MITTTKHFRKKAKLKKVKINTIKVSIKNLEVKVFPINYVIPNYKQPADEYRYYFDFPSTGIAC